MAKFKYAVLHKVEDGVYVFFGNITKNLSLTIHESRSFFSYKEHKGKAWVMAYNAAKEFTKPKTGIIRELIRQNYQTIEEITVQENKENTIKKHEIKFEVTELIRGVEAKFYLNNSYIECTATQVKGKLVIAVRGVQNYGSGRLSIIPDHANYIYVQFEEE